MKEWWTTKAWPWIKDHWQWILFPVGILMLVARLWPRPGVVTIDPTAKADERAKEEQAKRDADAAAEKARREAGLAAEQAALAARLAAVRQEHQAKLQRLTDDQMHRAAQLEDDPEALNAWLKTL
jgi:hypothetical protein